MDAQVSWSEHWVISFLISVQVGHVAVSGARGQARSLAVLNLQVLGAFKCLYFIVAKVTPDELEFNKAYLIEEIVVVVVGLVQHKLEVLAGNSQVHCL